MPLPRPLTVLDLVMAANAAYDRDQPLAQGNVLNYHANPGDNWGDGLARFIAAEVTEVFDPQASDLDNVRAVRDALVEAEARLSRVRQRFDDLVGDLAEGPRT